MTTSKTMISESVQPGQQLLLKIAQMLVDESAAVQVKCLEENGITTLNLQVAPGDVGKVVGKQGRTARSLRTIVSASGMKLHRRYCLNIQEDDSASESVERLDTTTSKHSTKLRVLNVLERKSETRPPGPA